MRREDDIFGVCFDMNAHNLQPQRTHASDLVKYLNRTSLFLNSFRCPCVCLSLASLPLSCRPGRASTPGCPSASSSSFSSRRTQWPFTLGRTSSNGASTQAEACAPPPQSHQPACLLASSTIDGTHHSFIHALLGRVSRSGPNFCIDGT